MTQKKTRKPPAPAGARARRLADSEARKCRECGCSELNPCTDPDDGGPCYWVERDLCSTCAKRFKASISSEQLQHPVLLLGVLGREMKNAAQLTKELPTDGDKYYGSLRILIGCLDRAKDAAEMLLSHAEDMREPPRTAA